MATILEKLPPCRQCAIANKIMMRREASTTTRYLCHRHWQQAVAIAKKMREKEGE